MFNSAVSAHRGRARLTEADTTANTRGNATSWAHSPPLNMLENGAPKDGSAPRTGMFTCVWIVISTKDRHIYQGMDGVQHQGQRSVPRTGIFTCVWMVFSTKDRHVHLCVDSVQYQGQACSPVCGWCSVPRTGMFTCVWMVFSTKDRHVHVKPQVQLWVCAYVTIHYPGHRVSHDRATVQKIKSPGPPDCIAACLPPVAFPELSNTGLILHVSHSQQFNT
ncbi:hypothetical protein Bbelb_191820 [Branchiostoma belcheri]|nr:hypothetical protein Bbelb_191820 [Branchiostoma belcheri]